MSYLLNPYIMKSSIFPTYGDGSSNNTKNAYTDNLYASSSTISSSKFTGGKNTAMAGNCYNYLGDIDSSSTKISGQDNASSGLKYIYSGTNNYSYSTTPSNSKWTQVFIRAGGGTTGVVVGSFKLGVSGSYYTVAQAISSGFIEPLVLTNSNAWSTSYYWINAHSVLTGNTDTANYPQLFIVYKPKVVISGFQLYSNIGFNTSYDGWQANQFNNLNVSLTPFDF